MAERRYNTVLFAAILTALVATFGVYRYLQKAKQSSQVHDAVRGHRLPRSDGRGKARGASRSQRRSGQQARRPIATFSSVDSAIGRVARVAIFKGEPIVPGRLAPPGTGPGLEVKIATGKRAMAVQDQ